MSKGTKGIIIILAVAIPAIIVAVALTSGKSEAPVTSDLEQGTTSQQTALSSEESGTAATETDAQKVSVDIRDRAYSPANITVKAGTTVTWTNQDSTRHDVVATNASADAPSSDLLAKGESYSFTFNKPGTYNYYCTPHPFMKGKVVVTE